MLVDIYRSERKEGLYLYVKKDTALDSLPEALIKHCGKLTLSMTIMLSKDKKLARAEASAVMNKVEEEGFYMQMPPSVLDDYMMHIPNDKIAKT